MYQNILVPVALDHERDVQAALSVARALSAEGGKITALTVVEAVPEYILSELPEGQLERNKAAALDALNAEVAGGGTIETVSVTGHSAHTILQYAEDHGVDCIVIASHRPSMQDYLLGSTAARVVRHAPCAVHVVR